MLNIGGFAEQKRCKERTNTAEKKTRVKNLSKTTENKRLLSNIDSRKTNMEKSHLFFVFSLVGEIAS